MTTTTSHKPTVALLALLGCLAGLHTLAAQAQTRSVTLDPQSLLQALNKVRARGCNGSPVAMADLHIEPRLSAAAGRVAEGAPLANALKAASYRSPRTTLISLSGYAGAPAIAQGAANHACQTVMDAEFQEMGFFAKGPQVWIVLATPFLPPLAADKEQIEARVLYLVNQARSQARHCGSEALAAAQPVRLNARLHSASAAHAEDMARYSYFSHTGRDGFHVSERANRTGYVWRAIGENIASGQMNADVAVQGWLKSPTHCANLMMPSYTEMGLAFAVNPQSDGGVYWVQVFGLPSRDQTR
jgi:uncharacterized protein YkwD